MPAILPNTTLKIRVVISGLSRIHAGPRMVCLYSTVKLRLTNSRVRSRYCHSSRKLMSNQPLRGRMMVVQPSSAGRVDWIFSAIGHLFLIKTACNCALIDITFYHNTRENTTRYAGEHTGAQKKRGRSPAFVWSCIAPPWARVAPFDYHAA